MFAVRHMVLALLNLANRPALVAIVLVLLCWLLLRPRPPRTARRTPSAGAATGAAASGARAVSVSTPGVLLSFRGGAPVVDDAAVAALLTLAATCDIYLVTQLESDTNPRPFSFFFFANPTTASVWLRRKPSSAPRLRREILQAKT